MPSTHPAPLALLLVGLLLLSGCAAPSFVDDDSGADTDEPTHADPAAVPPADPSPSSTPPSAGPDSGPGSQSGPSDHHGDVQGDEGETTTRKNDQGQYVAEKRVVLQNGIGNAALVDLLLSVDFANVTVVAANVGSYTYTFDLDVRADTEAQARNGMDRVSVVHEDTLADGTLTLDTHVRKSPANGLPIGSGLEPSEDLSYDLRIEVPRHLAYGLDLDADFSAFTSAPLAWTTLDLGGDYSALTFADAVGLKDLDASLDYGELSLRTAPAGGSWSVVADYASINIQAYGDAAYDVQASGSYNSIQIHLPDTEDVAGPDGGTHVRTRGYADHDVQVDAGFDLSFGSLVMNG